MLQAPIETRRKAAIILLYAVARSKAIKAKKVAAAMDCKKAVRGKAAVSEAKTEKGFRGKGTPISTQENGTSQEYMGIGTDTGVSTFTPNPQDYIGFQDTSLTNSGSNLKQYNDENHTYEDPVMNRNYESQLQSKKSELQTEIVSTMLDSSISDSDKRLKVFYLSEQIDSINDSINSNRIGTSGCFITAIANDLNDEFKRLGINKTVTVEELNNLANQKDAQGNTLYTGASSQ